jgi:TPR repeat protein
VRLYRLAADQGDADAQNNLGEIHESGRGVEKSPDQALQWYERAAERGLAAGQFNAGRMWAIGAAGKSDAVRARAWLAQAEQKGVSQARQVLDWLDQHDEGTPSTSATSSSTPLSNGSQSR